MADKTRRDDKWQCGTCGARNDPGTAVCYRCGTPRLIPPIPGTRVYDPLRAPTEPGKAPVQPGPPAAPEPEEQKGGDKG